MSKIFGTDKKENNSALCSMEIKIDAETKQQLEKLRQKDVNKLRDMIRKRNASKIDDVAMLLRQNLVSFLLKNPKFDGWFAVKMEIKK